MKAEGQKGIKKKKWRDDTKTENPRRMQGSRREEWGGVGRKGKSP